MQADSDVIELRDWHDQAACRGMDPALWFPEKGCPRHGGAHGNCPRGCEETADNHGRQGREICALCPVAAECLEDALRRREKRGIWGGASERRRRRLLPLFLRRRHDYSPECSDPRCEWCPLVREHLTNVSGDADRPFNLNGPYVTHGRRSTYARGCRCAMCCFAVSSVGVRFDYAGWDVPSWWDETFGDATGPELTDIAKMYAEQLLEIAA